MKRTSLPLHRREFITLLGGAAAAWPLAARAQQQAVPVVGLVSGRSADASARPVAAFRKGLNETGYVEGQNAMVEYHWLEGQYNRLPSLMADLVRRRVEKSGDSAKVPLSLAAVGLNAVPSARADNKQSRSSARTHWRSPALDG